MNAESRPDPNWLAFEKAVASFVKAMGDAARVTHDAKLPDAHTGTVRQRDVWVEWKVGGHFPAKALISCKYWSKPLDQQDIDHFNGEFLSSGAQIGIIYSKEGFNENALKKCEALGFHACQLFRNEPPQLPSGLAINHMFLFKPEFRVVATGFQTTEGQSPWNQIINHRVGSETIRNLLERSLADYQDAENREARWGRAHSGHVFRWESDSSSIELHVRDRAFVAKIEYMMLEGSYNLSSDEFLGAQAGPWVNTQAADPGPGWEQVPEIPSEMPNRASATYFLLDPKEAIDSYETWSAQSRAKET